MVRVYGGAPPVITELKVLAAPKHASPLPVSVAPVSGAPTVTTIGVPVDSTGQPLASVTDVIVYVYVPEKSTPVEMLVPLK